MHFQVVFRSLHNTQVSNQSDTHVKELAFRYWEEFWSERNTVERL